MSSTFELPKMIFNLAKNLTTPNQTLWVRPENGFTPRRVNAILGNNNIKYWDVRWFENDGYMWISAQVAPEDYSNAVASIIKNNGTIG